MGICAYGTRVMGRLGSISLCRAGKVPRLMADSARLQMNESERRENDIEVLMQVPSVLVSTPSGGAEGLDKPVWYHRQTVMLRPCLDDRDSRIGSLADVGREFSGEGRVDSVFCPWLRRQRHEENSVRRVLRLVASGKPGSLGRLIIRGWSSSKLPCIASFAQKRSLTDCRALRRVAAARRQFNGTD